MSLFDVISDSHLGVVVSIQTSILVGCILLLFLENQHLENRIEDRFIDMMGPFYHKLTGAILIIGKISSLVSYIDKNREYAPDLRRLFYYFKGYNHKLIMGGGDMPFMKTDELEVCCNNINQIWWILDKGSIVKDNIRFSINTALLNQTQAIIKKHAGEELDLNEININYLQNLCGNFYVEDWQPVQYVTINYEYYREKYHKLNLFIIASLCLTLASLLCIVWFHSQSELSYLMADVSTTIVIIALCICFIQYIKHTELNTKFNLTMKR